MKKAAGEATCGHAELHEHCAHWPGIGHLCDACDERLTTITRELAAAMLAYDMAAHYGASQQEVARAAAAWGKAVDALSAMMRDLAAHRVKEVRSGPCPRPPLPAGKEARSQPGSVEPKPCGMCAEPGRPTARAWAIADGTMGEYNLPNLVVRRFNAWVCRECAEQMVVEAGLAPSP